LLVRVLHRGEEVVVTTQQGRRILLRRAAQETDESPTLLPQLAHLREIAAVNEAQGEEAAVDSPCTRSRDHVAPRRSLEEVGQLAVGPPRGHRRGGAGGTGPGGRSTSGRLRRGRARDLEPTGRDEALELERDPADPDGEAHPAVHHDGNPYVLPVFGIELNR